MLEFFKKYKFHFFTFLAFTFITWLFFPKLFSGFFTDVESNDGRLIAYTISWDIHSFLTHPLSIFDANYFFPQKNTLCYSEHLIGTAIWGIPVWLLTNGNPAATFNFLMITGFVLNAFCSFLLIRKLVNNNAIAFLGAFLNGFCSYRLYNIGHLQNTFVFYIPLCLLFFYNFLESKQLKYLIGVGACLYLQSISSWYHMVFIFLMLGLFIAYYFFVEEKISNAELMKVVVMMGIVFVCIIPLAIPYLRFNKQSNAAFSMGDITSADIGGYLLPSPYTFGNQFFSKYLGITKSRWLEDFNFIGYVSLFFSIFGLFKWYRNNNHSLRFRLQKHNVIFIMIAGVFGLLSLGPYLIINDLGTEVKGPYYIVFKLVSPIRFLRCVARYSTIVFLMMSILASYGLVNVLAGIRNKVNRNIAFVLVFALAAFDYAPAERFNRFSNMGNIPEVYNKIKNDRDVKALVELPIDINIFNTTKYLYYAGIHFKPVVNGYNGYIPPIYYQYKETFEAPVNEFTVTMLKQIGVTHILCNPNYRESMDSSFVELVMQNEGYRLYKIKPVQIVSFYVDNVPGWTDLTSTNDSTLHIEHEWKGVKVKGIDLNGVDSNGVEGDTLKVIIPEKPNSTACLTYTSNKPLHMAFLKFRTAAITDTLQIQCFRSESNKPDSIVKSYVFMKGMRRKGQYMALPVYNSNKIIIRLHAGESTEGAWIRSLAFTARE